MSVWFSTLIKIILLLPTQIFALITSKEDQIIISDISFKITTKCSSAALLIMIVIYNYNWITGRADIVCHTNFDQEDTQQVINNYCWKYGTFLVETALQPENQHKVIYPGVVKYRNENDEIIKQEYFVMLRYILPLLAILMYAPFFVWKDIAIKKIRPIVVQEISVKERVSIFITKIPFNSSFAWKYIIICKLLGSLTLILCFWSLVWIFGPLPKYFWYGIEVVKYLIHDSSSKSWPSSQETLFPKIANCQFKSGDDVELIHCELPINNINGPIFFLFWWYLVIALVVNLGSCIYKCVMGTSFRRNSLYRHLMEIICRKELTDVMATNSFAKLLHYLHYKRLSPTDFLRVNLGVGDWLVLDLIKANLQDWEFVEFIHELALTPNSALQIIAEPGIVGQDAKFNGNFRMFNEGEGSIIGTQNE